MLGDLGVLVVQCRIRGQRKSGAHHLDSVKAGRDSDSIAGLFAHGHHISDRRLAIADLQNTGRLHLSDCGLSRATVEFLLARSSMYASARARISFSHSAPRMPRRFRSFSDSSRFLCSQSIQSRPSICIRSA